MKAKQMNELYSLRDQIAELITEYQDTWTCQVRVEIRADADADMVPLNQLRMVATENGADYGTSYVSLTPED